MKIFKLTNITKQASMTLHVKGFPYQEFPDINNMLDYSHNVMYKFYQLVEDILSPEEIAIWHLQRPIEMISPDGDDHFKPNGIMNFYLDGLPQNKIQILIQKLIELLNISNLTTDTPYIDSYMDYYNSHKGYFTEKEDIQKIKNQGNTPRVARIPIIKNNNQHKPDDKPPYLNINNNNTYFIFNKVLGYNSNQLEGQNFDANELIRRSQYFLGETSFQQTSPQEQEEYNQKMQEGFFSNMENTENVDEFANLLSGRSGVSYYTEDDIRRQLQRIIEFCQWTLNKGYQTIYLA